MENNESLIVSVELRASEADDDSPGTLAGLILPVGRIAADRKEVFVPGAATFPEGGVRLLLEHEGREIMTFDAHRSSMDGYRIEAALPITALKVSKPPSLSSRESDLICRSSSRAIEEDAFPMFEKCDALSSPQPHSWPAGAYAQARAELRGS